MRLVPALPLLIAAALPQPALAQVAAADSGDTAWMLLCALLLMVAALPGMMLRLAGGVSVRNALSISAQVAGVAAIGSLLWVMIGYSLAFAPGSTWIGGSLNLMLTNLAALRDGMTVPESVFVLFQLALALMAVGLLVGSVAERAPMGWWMGFAPLWMLIVYVPVVHGLWNGGWLAQLGVMDFAGGLAVHMLAGFSALALTLIAGRRSDSATQGHAPLLSLAGGMLLWLGLAGSVGGWALGATDVAGVALLNHHVAACAGALVWALIERIGTGRSSATGFVSGAIAGIAGIAASAALVGAGGAIMTGAAAALSARLVAGLIARHVDDGAGTFALHGVGGGVGALLLPVVVLPMLGGVGFESGITPASAITAQAIGVIAIALWALVGSAMAALIVSVVIPMRVSATDEAQGLDASQHGQQAWDFR